MIVSGYSIHRLAYLMEALCVLCEARTDPLYIMRITYNLRRVKIKLNQKQCNFAH